MVVKARNHSRVASALPHSEGIAYKPPCGEVAMCREWGGWGRLSRTDRDSITRTRARAPGAEGDPPSKAVHRPVGGPAQYGTTAPTLGCTKGDGKPAVSRRMPGAGLSL